MNATRYYDCIKYNFTSLEAAVAWFEKKTGRPPRKIIHTMTSWLLGPTDEDDEDEPEYHGEGTA